MHSQNAIRSYLAKRTGFHVHFTPTSVSWINLVERWFAALIEKQIRRGVHRSFRELEATIKDYLALTNASPRPFIWTKTADEIPHICGTLLSANFKDVSRLMLYPKSLATGMVPTSPAARTEPLAC